MSINTPAPASQPRTDPRPPDTGPGAARDYACRLREDGGTYRGIAAAAGLAPTTVHDLVSGRRPGTPYTATALRTVTSQALPRARLDAGGTRLRLRALHVMGHGSARIARAAGVREMTIRALVRGEARTISPQLRDTIAGVYDVEHPGFGGDSILPRCSGLGDCCLPRYRRLAEPRSDHFSALVLSNICPAALSSRPAWWRAAPARPAPGGWASPRRAPRIAPRVPRAGQG